MLIPLREYGAKPLANLSLPPNLSRWIDLLTCCWNVKTNKRSLFRKRLFRPIWFIPFRRLLYPWLALPRLQLFFSCLTLVCLGLSHTVVKGLTVVVVGQCQIYGHLGNLSERCYYWFDRWFDGPLVVTGASFSSSLREGVSLAALNPSFAYESLAYTHPSYGSVSNGHFSGTLSHLSPMAQVNQVSYLPRSNGSLYVSPAMIGPDTSLCRPVSWSHLWTGASG
ncbi:uncharacterized protein LOC128040562 [Gossypium raimondii]|uniref:uncharacterized protein LOC128040562 n=1 Tax=Gossypium raimondii TaxID=29730 RepID=UPI00227A5E79|nr:uncharacterized protein LOC128040562 [Gossypium raimondii]XP_052485488.1 uncharacterized protein LOC128040562 [Gossypium raimondii]